MRASATITMTHNLSSSFPFHALAAATSALRLSPTRAVFPLIATVPGGARSLAAVAGKYALIIVSGNRVHE